jgi:hypothetical protein
MLDQRLPKSQGPAGVAWMHRDLLDAGVAVHDVSQQVRRWLVVGANCDPGASLLLVSAEIVQRIRPRTRRSPASPIDEHVQGRTFNVLEDGQLRCPRRTDYRIEGVRDVSVMRGAVDGGVVDLEPRSASSSSISRYDSAKRRYERTAKTITSGGKQKPQRQTVRSERD